MQIGFGNVNTIQGTFIGFTDIIPVDKIYENTTILSYSTSYSHETVLEVIGCCQNEDWEFIDKMQFQESNTWADSLGYIIRNSKVLYNKYKVRIYPALITDNVVFDDIDILSYEFSLDRTKYNNLKLIEDKILTYDVNGYIISFDTNIEQGLSVSFKIKGISTQEHTQTNILKLTDKDTYTIIPLFYDKLADTTYTLQETSVVIISNFDSDIILAQSNKILFGLDSNESTWPKSISFDANGGSGSVPVSILFSNETTRSDMDTNIPTSPRAGYYFCGWGIEERTSSLNNTVYNIDDTISSDFIAAFSDHFTNTSTGNWSWNDWCNALGVDNSVIDITLYAQWRTLPYITFISQPKHFLMPDKSGSPYTFISQNHKDDSESVLMMLVSMSSANDWDIVMPNFYLNFELINHGESGYDYIYITSTDSNNTDLEIASTQWNDTVEGQLNLTSNATYRIIYRKDGSVSEDPDYGEFNIWNEALSEINYIGISYNVYTNKYPTPVLTSTTVNYDGNSWTVFKDPSYPPLGATYKYRSATTISGLEQAQLTTVEPSLSSVGTLYVQALLYPDNGGAYETAWSDYSNIAFITINNNKEVPTFNVEDTNIYVDFAKGDFYKNILLGYWSTSTSTDIKGRYTLDTVRDKFGNTVTDWSIGNYTISSTDISLYLHDVHADNAPYTLSIFVYIDETETTEQNLETVTATLHVRPKTISVNWSTENYTYDKQQHTPTEYTLSDLDYSYDEYITGKYYDGVNGTFYSSSIPPTDAGVYAVYLARNSYDITFEDYNNIFTISQKPLTVTWGTLSWPYDENSHSPSPILNGGILEGDTCELLLEGLAGPNVGRYEFIARTSNCNYTILWSDEIETGIITPVDAELPSISNVSQTYTGGPLTFNVGDSDDGIVKFSTDHTNWTTTKPTFTAVDTHVFWVRVEPDSNHNAVENSYFFDITKCWPMLYPWGFNFTVEYSNTGWREITSSIFESLGWRISSITNMYCGSIGITNLDYCGASIDGSEVINAIEIIDNRTISIVTPNVTSGSSLEYDIHFEHAEDETCYHSNDFIILNIQITPTAAEIPVYSEAANTFAYDGNPHTFTVGTSPHGTVEYSVIGNNSSASWSSTPPSLTNMNTELTVYMRVVGDSNHYAYTYGDPNGYKLRIASKLSATISNKTSLTAAISSTYGDFIQLSINGCEWTNGTTNTNVDNVYNDSTGDYLDYDIISSNIIITSFLGVGTYDIIVNLSTPETDVYCESTDSVTFSVTITKADIYPLPAPTNQSHDYSGEVIEYVLSYNGAGTLQYLLSTSTSWTETVPSRLNAGTTSFQIRILGDANHNTANIGTYTLTVNKVNAVLPLVKTTGEYTGDYVNPMPIGHLGGSLYFSYDGNTWNEDIPAIIGPGEINYYMRVVGDNNHNTVTSTGMFTFTVVQKLRLANNDREINITLDYRTTEFDIDIDNRWGPTDSGYKVLSEYNYSTILDEQTNHIITLSLESSHIDLVNSLTIGRHTLRFAVNALDVSEPYFYGADYIIININAAIPLTLPTISNTSLQYTGTLQTFTATGGSTAGDIMYSTNGTTWSTDKPYLTNVGSIYVYYKIESNQDSYMTVEGTPFTFTINKAPAILPQISDYNGEYDGEPHSIIIEELSGGPYVDLGLPSGMLWASCNVGTENPCDYGEYFMWGSIEDNSNSDCSWDNVPFDFNPPTVLPTDNDVVYQRTNGAAHMPTKADIQELLDGTTSTWCQCTVLGDDHTTHNVYGRLFTSKTNSNNIFIPAAGCRDGSSFNVQGSYCSLWSSSLNESSPCYAWSLYFDSDYTDVSYNDRSYGLSVRGVTDTIYNTQNLQYTIDGITVSDVLPSRTDAGTTTVQVISPADDNHYESRSQTYNIVINKIDAILPTIGDNVYTYDGNPHSFNYSGGSGGTVQYKIDNGNWENIDDFPDTILPTALNISIRVLGDNNHNTIYYPTSVWFVIERIPAVLPTINNNANYTYTGLPITVPVSDDYVGGELLYSETYNPSGGTLPTITNTIHDYDGSPKTFTISGTPSGTVEYSTNGSSWSTTKPTRTNAGSTLVYIRVNETDNYTSVSTTLTLTVNAVSATLPTISNNTHEYDGNPKTFEATGGSGGTVQYSTNGSSWSTVKPTQTAKGSTLIYIRILPDSNHTAVSDQFYLTINNALPTFPTIGDNNFVYDGTNHTFNISGWANCTLEYSTVETGERNWTDTLPSRKDAGVTDVYIRITGDDNHEGVYEIGPYELTVNKGDSQLPSISNLSKTYNATQQTFTVTGGSGGTVQYSTDGLLWTDIKPTLTNAEDISFYVKVFGDSNHNDSEISQQYNFTILQKSVNVIWGNTSWIYGHRNYVPEVSVNNDIDETVSLVTSPTYAGPNVGTGTFTVSTTNTNYTLTNTTKNWQISKHTIYVDWGTYSWVYDGNTHVPNPTPVGIYPGDTINLIVSGEAGPNVGDYDITVSTDSLNYNINISTVSITSSIYKADIDTPLYIQSTSAIYNGTFINVILNTTITGGTVKYRMYGKSTWSAITPSIKNVGNIKFYIKVFGDDNHNDSAESNLQTFTVAPKDIDVVWTDTVWAYDKNKHQPNASANTGIDGETVTLSITKAQGPNVGNYTFIATQQNSNYNLINNTVICAITNAAPTYSTVDTHLIAKIYSTTNTTFNLPSGAWNNGASASFELISSTYTASNGNVSDVNYFTLVDNTIEVVANTPATTGTDFYTLTIDVTCLPTANYSAGYATYDITLEITKANCALVSAFCSNITWTNKNSDKTTQINVIQENAADIGAHTYAISSSIDGTYSNSVDGVATVSNTGIITFLKPAVIYWKVTCSATSNFEEGTFTSSVACNKGTLEIEKGSCSKIYNGQPQSVDITIKSDYSDFDGTTLVYGETADYNDGTSDISALTAAHIGQQTDICSITYQFKILGGTYYHDYVDSLTLIINPYTVSVEWQNTTWEYSGLAHDTAELGTVTTNAFNQDIDIIISPVSVGPNVGAGLLTATSTNSNFVLDNNSVVWEITPKTLFVSCNDKTIAYGTYTDYYVEDANNTGLSQFTVTGFVNNEDRSILSGTFTPIVLSYPSGGTVPEINSVILPINDYTMSVDINITNDNTDNQLEDLVDEFIDYESNCTGQELSNVEIVRTINNIIDNTTDNTVEEYTSPFNYIVVAVENISLHVVLHSTIYVGDKQVKQIFITDSDGNSTEVISAYKGSDILFNNIHK